MSGPLSSAQLSAIRLVCDAVLSAVEAAGSAGAPGGVLYAALMSQGCTMNQFQGIMGILVKSGRVRQCGDLYVASGKGGSAS